MFFCCSPRKSPYKQSPIKRDTTSEKRPAFERFHALAQPPSSHLVLPYKYKVLNEVFRCLETVVTMLYNRKECIYFNKLKPAVQKMLQR
jgi:chromatin licensing and DNA replication factor 1